MGRRAFLGAPAGCLPRRPAGQRALRGLATCLFALASLLSLPSPEALALPVLAEGRVRSGDGNPAVAQRAALAVALAGAVEAVLNRHVPRSELESRAREVKSAFLARPSPYILRYAISSEGTEGGDFVVALQAEVAQDKVLDQLRAMGFGVRFLEHRPRILLVALGDVTAEAARRVLEAQGYVVRVLPGAATAPPEPTEAARWARDLGCHVAFVLADAAGVEAEESPSVAGPAPEVLPAPSPSRASARATGWIVDARGGSLLGQAEAEAAGEGADPVAAAARAGTRVGERLAGALLARLEQSGWSPGQEVQELDLVVHGLPGPASVEALQRALPSVTEVRQAMLREVGHRRATWRLRVVDAGLGPEAVVRAVQVPRGRLTVLGVTLREAGGPFEVRAEWSEH